MNECDLKVWIEENCPQLYGMLNTKARNEIPLGFVEYLDGGSKLETERDNLSSIERHLSNLVKICGLKMVADNYRRDLSGVNSENQVSELFCEIALCASLGEYSQNLRLHPPTGKGTNSDCSFNLGGFNIYGEAKRYVDPWPYIESLGNNPNKKVHDKRSISQAPNGKKPNDSARPRAMDLRSKLRDVYKQLPDESLNILFVFHSSYAESHKYITQVLFGNSNFFQTDSDYTLEKDGLFSIDEWQNISSCCFSRVNPDSKVVFPFLWKNPRASIELPEVVYNELKYQIA